MNRTLAQRILRALESGPIAGQTDLMNAVLGPQRDLEQCEAFRLALRYHLVHPIGVIEERVQVPATGIDGPPVFEYRYRLPTAAEAAASRAVVRSPQPDRNDPSVEEGTD